ncbi:MAG: MmgE/PrpD family protein [Rhodospirillales bacterium]|nr:MmgE/PrpD family protein [Rhodospirillales bacterium]
MTVETKISEFVANLDARALTPDVLTPLRLGVLDCIACILAGTREAVAVPAVTHAIKSAGNGAATIIGFADRASLAGAAFANGTLGHASDYDDVSWSMWGHATAPVLPAVLAVAESRNLSGLELLVAFLAGIEVEARLGEAAAPMHLDLGWHPTATIGTFGAAVAAAKALRLDAEGIRAAIGIAASRAAGIRENFGTMVKPMHVGFAARDGLEAAMLAAAGVTSSVVAVGGAFGFLDNFAKGHRAAAPVFDRLGKPFDIVSPGLSYKMYPSCSDTHPSVDGVLDLRHRHKLAPISVRRLRSGVMANVYGNLTYHQPKTATESKFSLEYCIAAAMVRDRLSLTEFEPGALDDPEVRDMMTRTEAWIDPALPKDKVKGFASPASVEIETADGRTFKTVVVDAIGHPEKPMSEGALKTKFEQCAAGTLERRAARRAIDLILQLETLPDVRALTAALTPAAATFRSAAGA